MKTDAQGIKSRHKKAMRYLPHYQVRRKEEGKEPGRADKKTASGSLGRGGSRILSG